ncbi:hypothetical protein QTP70_000824 [Hemibagrus guttatus]|uniref:Reverse transcriptase n=1 Tax=Hemibagrus guttatus TaxID=175788 RepID=A0AAE0Q5K4_9TELE|nr:hypothetical protein QTP70_000824 [Hemibagrus guttatus]
MHGDAAHDRQKLYHDAGLRHQPYYVGAMVWLHNPVESRMKLAPHWKGPYRIAQVMDSCGEQGLTYRIKNPFDSGERAQIVHYNRLRPYTLPVSPRSQNKTLSNARDSQPESLSLESGVSGGEVRDPPHESREQVEENLERWRFALERRGMKVSRSKTEYMCVNEREGSGTVRLQGEEVKKVQEFKYLRSTVQSNGECGKEVKKRVQAGWNGWRKVSGVLCDRKISARIKGKVYRTVVRPAMLYGLETVSLRKRQESELEVAELKMLRFSLGVTRLDRIRNEYIRGTAHVGRLGDKVREARLRWFGHVQRRQNAHSNSNYDYNNYDYSNYNTSLPSI